MFQGTMLKASDMSVMLNSNPTPLAWLSYLKRMTGRRCSFIAYVMRNIRGKEVSFLNTTDPKDACSST